MAKTAAQRQREKRERDRQRREQHEAQVLAYRLNLDIYKGTAAHLARIMTATQIEEQQDIITRLSHRCAQMPDAELKEFLAQP